MRDCALEIDTDSRRRTRDVLVVIGLESACLGWQTAPMPVLEARDRTATTPVKIMQGDDIGFGHIPIDG